MIALDLRVIVRSVERWRQPWQQGGSAARESKGPQSLPRLSELQFDQLERELEKGPLAHGWEDQRWTLAADQDSDRSAVPHLLYRRGRVWKLVRRNGWSCQQPVRRAIERDDGAVEVWKRQVRPQVIA